MSISRSQRMIRQLTHFVDFFVGDNVGHQVKEPQEKGLAGLRKRVHLFVFQM